MNLIEVGMRMDAGVDRQAGWLLTDVKQKHQTKPLKTWRFNFSAFPC